MGLPTYTSKRVEPLKTLSVSKTEKTSVDNLVEALVRMKRVGIEGIDLLEGFVSHCVQPLQERVRPMYMYDGLSDRTRMNLKAITVAEIEGQVKRITVEPDVTRGSEKVVTYDLTPTSRRNLALKHFDI